MNASKRSAALILGACLAMIIAAPAAADDTHSHGDNGHSHGDDRVIVLWEGAGSDALDCDALDEGQIRWELDPGTGHDVTSVELHIDEPRASVTVTQGPPFVWITPYYELGTIEADADGFVGEPGPDAELAITAFCPGDLAETGNSVPFVVSVVAAVAVLAGVVAIRRRVTL